MRSVEINLDLDLDENKKSQVELHSFHNVMTVLYGELQFLEKVLGRKNLLVESRDICNRFLKSISNLETAKKMVENWSEFQSKILEEVKYATGSNPIEPKYREMASQSEKNLVRILAVVEERVKEFISRIDSPGEWRPFLTETVKRQLRQVLVAIAQNSKGRYGVVFEPDQKGEGDYLVNISVQSERGSMILMPPILLDSLRDLTANARKYTEPGGTIECNLTQNKEELTLSVSDTGRGIPENEIEQVVLFGVRGSNTTPSETKGGGYGLTKAAYICRQHGGRMWIESELGSGAKVTLRIPNPRKS